MASAHQRASMGIARVTAMQQRVVAGSMGWVVHPGHTIRDGIRHNYDVQSVGDSDLTTLLVGAGYSLSGRGIDSCFLAVFA